MHAALHDCCLAMATTPLTCLEDASASMSQGVLMLTHRHYYTHLYYICILAGGRKADALHLTPDRQASQAAAGSGAVCTLSFNTPILTMSGQYSVTAEYNESRTELLAALSKQVQHAFAFLHHGTEHMHLVGTCQLQG